MSEKEVVKQAIREVFGFENEQEALEFKLVLPTLMSMAKDWQAALKFGKWITGLATFLSILFAIWESIKAIFFAKRG
jgi:hypothetical protein